MTDIIPTTSDQQPIPTNTSARQDQDDGEPRENRDRDGNRPLFPSHQCTTLEKEWQGIQANFVDSPRDAVKQADALVTKTIDILSSSFAEMRGSMERTWEKDGDVSTEELRLAMQNYRSFFHRLLSI